MRNRRPRLPSDFDRRFFSAAAPGLVAPGYLRGNEDVVVLNAPSVPRLALRLPAVAAPWCRVARRHRQDVHLQTNLDTLIVNSDEQLLMLLWRACTPGDPHDVTAIEVVAMN
jgi:hypothetical protein